MVIALNRCCCFELNLGIVILGWFNSIVSAAITITFGIALTCGNYVDDADPVYHELEASGISIKIALSFGCVIGIIAFIESILLIIGAMKRKRLLLLPYLVIGGLILIINSMSALITLFTIHGLPMAIVFLVFIMVLAIWSYLWLCVLSLYNVYKHEEMEKKERLCALRNSLEQKNGRSIEIL